MNTTDVENSNGAGQPFAGRLLNNNETGPGFERSRSETGTELRGVQETSSRQRGGRAAGGGNRGLGWLSLALGTAGTTAPGSLARLMGIDDCASNRLAIRLIGARELLSGVGLVSGRKPRLWLWSRVAGDLMDLGLLASALGARRSDRSRVNWSLAAIAGVTAFDLVTAGRAGRSQAKGARATSSVPPLRSQVTISRPPDALYRYWRELENLPNFMTRLQSVAELDGEHSRWTARGPAGRTVEWTAKITEDRPNEVIAWRSDAAPGIVHSGEVRFVTAPGGRGTEVQLTLEIELPGGAVPAILAKALKKIPQAALTADLRRFKQLMETGEVLHSDASIHSGLHPARPAAPETAGGR